MAADRAQNLQDTFLNHVRKTKTPLTIFLVNGVKLQGIVTWFDNFCLLLRRDGHSQLVYKHAISTIMPVTPVPLAAAALLRHPGERIGRAEWEAGLDRLRLALRGAGATVATTAASPASCWRAPRTGPRT